MDNKAFDIWYLLPVCEFILTLVKNSFSTEKKF